MLHKRGKPKLPYKGSEGNTKVYSLEKVESYQQGNDIKMEEYKVDYSNDDYANSFKNSLQKEHELDYFDSSEEDESNTRTSVNKITVV